MTDDVVFPRGDLMAGKRGLIMGVANDHSIAWGVAQQLAAQGAELAFTYQGDALERRVRPLADSVGAELVIPCDVTDDISLDEAFEAIKSAWGRLDFLVHAIAFSDRNELKGRFVDTSRENFLNTLNISCYSFVDVCRRAAALAPESGGACVTMSYFGAEKVVPSYNVMGVAKAALEASVRYLAADLGADRIRVNAISAGPMRTLAAAGVGGARAMYKWCETHAPINEAIDHADVGGAGLYLLSDLSKRVTGEVLYVDSGYNVVGMPRMEKLD